MKIATRTLLPASIIGLAHWLFADLDPDEAENWHCPEPPMAVRPDCLPDYASGAVREIATFFPTA